MPNKMAKTYYGTAKVITLLFNEPFLFSFPIPLIMLEIVVKPMSKSILTNN